jgi:hypothetical protein
MSGTLAVVTSLGSEATLYGNMMAAEAGTETRQGAESDEESDRCDEAQDYERVWVRNTTY